jgi:hypothetical protein
MMTRDKQSTARDLLQRLPRLVAVANADGATPVIAAASSVRCGVDDVCRVDACLLQGSLAIVEYLLNVNTDCYIRQCAVVVDVCFADRCAVCSDRNGWTVLHAACYGRDDEIIARLVRVVVLLLVVIAIDVSLAAEGDTHRLCCAQ